MQKNALVLAVLALLAGGTGLYAQSPQSLTMTNAEVVSVDPSQRIMVIKNTQGRQQTVELDDQLAGFAGIRTGDKVVLSLRKGPGRDRVMAISRGGAAKTTTTTTTTSGTSGTATSSAAPSAVRETRTTNQMEDTRVVSPATGTAVDPRADAALATYADRVAALAQQATEVDRLWGEVVTACKGIVDAHYDAREWLSLWDKQARLDTSAGSCRELVNQVITAGETINAGMAAAEDAGRTAGVAAGDLRPIRQRYAMDWEGWGRPAPARFDQP